jgi:hypothetical protein
MSRKTQLGIGIMMLLGSVLWIYVCFLVFIGLAVGEDSVPGASIFDSNFMVLYFVAGSGLLVILWCAFLFFRRAIRASRTDVPVTSAAPPDVSEPARRLTAEERLAHLVKKTES